MESSLLRSRKLRATGRGTNAGDMCAVFLRDGMDRVEMASRNVIGACLEGEAVGKNVTAVRLYANHHPLNAIALRRIIASRLLAAGAYTV